jgi:hypothetical protein
MSNRPAPDTFGSTWSPPALHKQSPAKTSAESQRLSKNDAFIQYAALRLSTYLTEDPASVIVPLIRHCNPWVIMYSSAHCASIVSDKLQKENGHRFSAEIQSSSSWLAERLLVSRGLFHEIHMENQFPEDVSSKMPPLSRQTLFIHAANTLATWSEVLTAGTPYGLVRRYNPEHRRLHVGCVCKDVSTFAAAFIQNILHKKIPTFNGSTLWIQ